MNVQADIEAIAAALAPLIVAAMQGAHFPSRGMVKAERVAAFLDVDVSWVYVHKAELGAVRLGDGRGALRFEAAKVLAYVRQHRLVPDDCPVVAVRPGPKRRVSSEVQLLPLPDGLR